MLTGKLHKTEHGWTVEHPKANGQDYDWTTVPLHPAQNKFYSKLSKFDNMEGKEVKYELVELDDKQYVNLLYDFQIMSDGTCKHIETKSKSFSGLNSSGRLSKKKRIWWEVQLFAVVREWKDGITFFKFHVNWDRYVDDHSPAFQIELVMLNVYSHLWIYQNNLKKI